MLHHQDGSDEQGQRAAAAQAAKYHGQEHAQRQADERGVPHQDVKKDHGRVAADRHKERFEVGVREETGRERAQESRKEALVSRNVEIDR